MSSHSRLPAEWEPQEAVWFAWPSSSKLWPQNRDAAEHQLAKLIAIATHHEPVALICPEAKMQQAAYLLRQADASLHEIAFMDIASNDIWCRDICPSFCLNGNSQPVMIDWIFNGWGENFAPWDKDDLIPENIEDTLGYQRIRAPFVCEGGAIEVNGRGQLMATEATLLNKNRNPSYSKSNIERFFKDHLDISETIWLEKGLSSDDTGGHIDQLARFAPGGAILLSMTKDKAHPDYKALEDNRERLKGARALNGLRFKIVDLPLPETRADASGRELAASYANFLILNGCLIVPAFGQESDERACKIIQECFPDREIIPLDSRVFLEEGGGIHCLAQTQPKPGISLT